MMLTSAAVVAVLSLLGAAVGLLNYLILARLFGASVRVDAYFIAICVPMLFSGTLTAALNYALVPSLIAWKREATQYARFSGLMFLCFLLVSLFFFLVGYPTATTLIAAFGVTLTGDVKTEAVLITRIAWLCGGLALIIGFLTAMHHAAKRFFLPVIANMLPTVGMTVLMLTFGRTLGPVTLAWGMLAGSVIAVLALLLRVFPDFDVSMKCLECWKEVVKFFLKIPLVMIATISFTVYQFADAYWASKLGAGNVSYLAYCQRILVAIGTVVIAGPAVVLGPRLSEASRDGRHREFLNDTARALRTTLAFATPLALIISILSLPLTRFLFEGGAFDQDATLQVASILPMMMGGMVPMLCMTILYRALFAKHAVISAALIGGFCAMAYFILSGFFSRTYSLVGFALAYNVSWWTVLVIAIIALWKKDIYQLISKENVTFAWQLFVSLVATAGLVSVAVKLLEASMAEMGVLGLLVGILASFGVGALGYYFVAARILGMPDIRIVVDHFRKAYFTSFKT